MTSAAPFRDLFVELPTTLLEALRGIGEQAAREAQRSPARPVQRQPSSAEALRAHEHAIMGIFGWTQMQAVYSPAEHTLRVAARLACGHDVRYALAKQAIVAEGIDWALYTAVGARPRTCFCVPHDVRSDPR